MPRIAIDLMGLALLAYLGLCALLFVFQRSLIYFPTPRLPGDPAPAMTLSVEGAQLAVTVRPREGAHAVIYFGGNAENVSGSLPELAQAFEDRAIYLMHYRGYGASTGKPNEVALFADALALFDQVRARHQHVTVVGRSLGSGVAVQLASVRSVERLVLVTPYDSILSLAEQQFPFVPVRWLLKDRFESWRYAPLVNAPTRLIAAERDEIIPAASTQALLTRFSPGVAELVTIAGAGHNTLSNSDAYVKSLNGSGPGRPR